MFPRKTANVCDKNEKCLWERTRATLCEKTTQRSHTNSIRTRSSVRRGIAHTPIATLPATACGAQWCVRGFCMTQKKPKYHQLAHPSLGMSGGARLSCPLQATACGHSVRVRQSTMNCTPDIQSTTQMQLTRGARYRWSGYDCWSVCT